MPQMMPMIWILLTLYFILLLIILLTLMFFIHSPSINKNITIKYTNAWIWQW